MSLSGVYQIEHLPSGRVYIGSAVAIVSRRCTHQSQLRNGKHKNRKLQSLWQRDGESAFAFRTLLLCAKKDLIFYEQRCIDAFDAVRSGLNVLPVAGSGLGYKHTKEHKARLSGNKHALGMRHTHETLARMSAASKGNKHSLGAVKPQSARDAVSRALKGKKQSPEQVAKRMAAHIGAKRSPEAIANMKAAWVRRKNGL